MKPHLFKRGTIWYANFPKNPRAWLGVGLTPKEAYQCLLNENRRTYHV